jgi:hypothetical protein
MSDRNFDAVDTLTSPKFYVSSTVIMFEVKPYSREVNETTYSST